MKYLKWPFLVVAILTGTVLLLKRLEPQPEPRLELSDKELPQAQALPAFSLIDGDGQTFDNKSLKSKWSVLFFGFTRCTSTCPVVMGYFKAEMEKLSPEEKARMQFALISVDPEFDKPETVKHFAARFNPDIKGITGSLEQLQILAGGFQTAFAKEQEDHKNRDIYMMAHSPRFFLVDPRGQWRGSYELPLKSGTLAEDLKRILKNEEPLSPVKDNT